MDRPTKKLYRCAIYTRKSTEHNLDLEFNSLDAQREACEAYIKSQAHEGWRLVPKRYDDGAFSGASLDRPALQKLLGEIRTGHIDVIVVYKVDRLTRSLADFAKLVELFDQDSVSFVSVTQSFNTTSSMGRLTLNVLLSFAQFEREVIGERVRDKIAASKRKGLWVGGPVPLGYSSINKKLVVVPEEAETVRLIFRRYLEAGSIRALVQDLDHRGVQTKRQEISNGRVRGGIRFGVGPLHHLLRNRFYIGEVVYRGAVHLGEHEPIVDRELFEAVQARLAASANARQLKLRASPSILTGRIFDDRGSRMTPTHTNKRGARYRYYVSHAILQKRKHEAGSVARVPADEIEDLVVRSVRDQVAKNRAGESSTPISARDLIDREVQRIVVRAGTVEIHMRATPEPGQHNKRKNAKRRAKDHQPPMLTLAWARIAISKIKGFVNSPQSRPAMSQENSEMLLTAIAKARAWIDDIIEGRIASFAEIAQREGKVERHIRYLMPLAFVSPRITSAVAQRSLPNMRIMDLAKAETYSWRQQERVVGMAT